MIPIVFAQYELDECQRIQDPADIPCLVISSWRPANCGAASNQVTIYNESDVAAGYANWTNLTAACYFTFNYTERQTYYYNSTLETGAIVVEADKMWLGILLLIPLGLGFFFIYWATSLNEIHEPFKWFLRLLAFFQVYVLYAGIDIILKLNPTYAGFLVLFDIGIFHYIFFTIFGFFMVYFLYRILNAMQIKKRTEFEQGFIR